MASDLGRLEAFDRRIRQLVRDEFGLDFYTQHFDVVSSEKMLEIMTYQFPVNFSHWSFGRDYERQRTIYEHGVDLPYEVVLNSQPCRAYIMRTNPLAVQVLVMGHVYAHNDFMKNNRHFQESRRDMIPSAADAARRFREYEERFGREVVEETIDAALAIRNNIDPHYFMARETEEEKRKRLSGPRRPPERPSPFRDLFPEQGAKPKPPGGVAPERRSPPEPERDLMLYIINNSPRPLEEWQKDILSTVRLQSLYLWPVRRTKIMNEGWAVYWHQRIMNRLFEEGMLDDEQHGIYNLYNSRLMAKNPRGLNPYLVGLRVFEHIKRRWDRGLFGPEYEDCTDRRVREGWDRKLGRGRDKVFSVRRSYSDRFFIEEFLTRELVEELDLYLYVQRDKGRFTEEVIVEDEDWKRIRRALVAGLTDYGIPIIKVEDGNYRQSRRLYLRHYFTGLPLDGEYRRKTMEHIYRLWGRPVYLETVQPSGEGGQRQIYCYNGEQHLEVKGLEI